MSSKTFRVAVQTERISFTLEYLQGGKPASKVFNCRPTVPVGLILQFADIGSMKGEDEKSGSEALDMIKQLYKAAIVPEEFPAFEALLDDPDAGITVDMYSEIAGWLAGEYTARPTGENSESSPPASSSGTDSTVGASPVVLSYSKSVPVEASA